MAESDSDHAIRLNKKDSFPITFDNLTDFLLQSTLDDSKYDNLLHDLRAHDLLGPLLTNEDEKLSSTNRGNAIQMNYFHSGNEQFKLELKAPPPGFASSERKAQAPQSESIWAQGNSEFPKLAANTVYTSNEDQMVDCKDLTDACQIPSLRVLNLDDVEEGNAGSAGVAIMQNISNPRYDQVPTEPSQIRNNTQPPIPVAQPRYMMMTPPQRTLVNFAPPPYNGPIHQTIPRYYKLMTPRDINFVVQQQMKQLQFSDPYSDDYYFCIYNQKRHDIGRNGNVAPPAGLASAPSQAPIFPHARSNQKSSQHQAPTPPHNHLNAPLIPLPSWQLKHIRLVNPEDKQRADKSRSWETENQVLGRNTKSCLHRPREMLKVSSRSAEASGETTSESSDVGRIKESGSLQEHASNTKANWRLRHTLDRGFACLLALQDAKHILDARHINVQDFQLTDGPQLDPSLVELRSKTTKMLIELAAIFGIALKQTEGSPDASVVQFNTAAFEAITAVKKGKQLLTRALLVMHPSARHALLPSVVKLIYSPNSMDSNILQTDDERICQAVVILLLYHPVPLSAQVLTEMLEMAISNHDIVSFHAILCNQPRAEALQKILQRGGAGMASLPHNHPMQARWKKAQDTFVSLATRTRTVGV